MFVCLWANVSIGFSVMLGEICVILVSVEGQAVLLSFDLYCFVCVKHVHLHYIKPKLIIFTYNVYEYRRLFGIENQENRFVRTNVRKQNVRPQGTLVCFLRKNNNNSL